MDKPKTRKRFLVHVKSVLTKLALDLQIDPSDVRYALQRLHSEGMAFVTKILPTFSKYAILCCEKQKILHAVDCGLTHFQLQGRSPRFMRGLLDLAVVGSASALSSIRQFCEYFYKAAFDFEKSELEAAKLKYILTDVAYEAEEIDWQVVRDCRLCLHNVLPVLSSMVPHELYRSVRPHDGPGSFAGSQRIVKYGKIDIGSYKKLPIENVGSHPKNLDPFSGYFKSYPSSPETPVAVPVNRTAELLFVPKDSRGPRTISKEPYHLLKAQMSLGKAMALQLERETCQRVNFTDQTVNQELARISSITRENATLDLKDASDRVWLSVVRAIVRYAPALRYAVENVRSTHVSLGKVNL